MKMSQCLFVVLFLLLHRLSKGRDCGIVDERLSNVCPSLCVGSQCTSDDMQAYTSTGMTSNVRGCLGDGMLSKTPSGLDNYEEYHVIYSASKDSKITKLYLTIKDAAAQKTDSSRSNITPIYNFVLLSSVKATWVVSFEKTNASYVFHTSSSSVVRDRLTGKKLDTTPARNVDVATGSGRPYWPMQIASFFEEAYGFDLDSRHLTSLVGLDTANALQISVGHSLQSGFEPKICEVPELPTGFHDNGYPSRVHASRLAFLPITQSCVGENTWNRDTEIYVLDISSNSSISTIKLRLIGASILEQNTTVVIVLRSSIPMIWEPVEDSDVALYTNYKFLVSSHSSVNFDTAWLSSKSVEYSSLLTAAQDEGQMLKNLSSRYGQKIKSYMKLNDDPDVAEIFLVDKKLLSEDEDRPSPHINFFLKLHGGINISSSGGAQLFIACSTLKLYELKASEIKVGNGNCGWNFTDDGLLYSNLSQCGLKRISQRDFNIMISARGRSQEILFRINSKPSTMTAFTDIRRTNPIQEPQVVTTKQNTFFTQISLSSFEKFGISSKVDHCYLSQNGTKLLDIIKNNCPVNNYTSFLVHGQNQPKGTIGFTLSFAPLLELKHVGNIDLICLFSKCLQPHVNLTWKSALPQCPRESDVECDLLHELDSAYPEQLMITFTIAPDQEAVVTSTFGKIVTTSTDPSTSTFLDENDEFKLATLILAVILGLLLLFFLAVVLYSVVMRPVFRSHFFKRGVKHDFQDYGAKRNHCNCEDTRLDASMSLIPASLPRNYEVYQKRSRLPNATSDSYERLDLSCQEQSNMKHYNERVLVTSARTKEDSTCSSSSSTSTDSGVVENSSSSSTSTDLVGDVQRKLLEQYPLKETRFV